MAYISYIPSPPLNAYIEDFYYLGGPSADPRQKVLPVASSKLIEFLQANFSIAV